MPVGRNWDVTWRDDGVLRGYLFPVASIRTRVSAVRRNAADSRIASSRDSRLLVCELPWPGASRHAENPGVRGHAESERFAAVLANHAAGMNRLADSSTSNASSSSSMLSGYVTIAACHPRSCGTPPTDVWIRPGVENLNGADAAATRTLSAGRGRCLGQCASDRPLSPSAGATRKARTRVSSRGCIIRRPARSRQ